MSQQPWRRGSTISQATQTRRTQSIWANSPSPSSNNSASPARSSQSINRDGLRMARKDLGGKREQDEFNLLLSPSRGVAEDDPTSLKNPAIQERFRNHISEKLKRWSQTHPIGALSPDLKRRNEELGIILLDLRKLREGIHSIRRIDGFACEVYEASVLLSLLASNQAQLLSSLPHLVTVIHPALARDDITTSLSALSVSSNPGKACSAPSQAVRSFYLTLYLLHSHLLPAFTTSSALPTSSAPSTTTSNPPLSTFLPTAFSLLSLSSLPQPPTLRPSTASSSTTALKSTLNPYITFLLQLHLALIHSSLSTVSKLFSPLPPPPSPISAHFDSLVSSSSSLKESLAPNPLALMLKESIPQLRERFYKSVIEKAFRFPPDPTEWLSEWLLFDFEVEIERKLGLNGLVERATEETKSSKGIKEDIAESWEEEAEDDMFEIRGKEEVKKEAERRAVQYVELKKKGL
ncbi:hypothetical protein JCM3765_002970 [Sporobolomyces pararoseus]